MTRLGWDVTVVTGPQIAATGYRPFRWFSDVLSTYDPHTYLRVVNILKNAKSTARLEDDSDRIAHPCHSDHV